MNIANQLHGPSILAATRFFKGASQPAPRDLYAETSDELQAKLDLAPKILEAEQQYRPQYAGLELQELERLLFGVPSSKSYDVNAGKVVTLPAGSTLPPGAKVVGQSFGSMQVRLPSEQGAARDVPGQRGFLDILRDLGPASDQFTAESLSRQRESELADVERLGPRATEAFRSANPAQAALLDLLNTQARQELELGATLDPSLRREIAQSVRAGQASRGFGYGQNDIAAEALLTGATAEQLRQARRTFASGVVGLNQGTSLDPFLATIGRPGLNLAQTQSLVGANYGRPVGPGLFGTQVNANDVFNTNFNAQASAANASANNQAATQGAAIAGGASLAGAAVLAIAL